MSLPIVWTIAGSDTGAGAGIQADLKTFNSLNVHGCTLLSALTAQNTSHVSAIEFLTSEFIAAQKKILLDEFPPLAVKTGMLGNARIIQQVAKFFDDLNTYVVCDPVIRSSSGDLLLEEQAIRSLKDVLFPKVDLLTPNRMEAETLVGYPIKNHSDIEKAAKDCLAWGVGSVVVKGGHSIDDFASDYWTNGKDSFWLHSPRIQAIKTHGTGCTFSAALTAAQALNLSEADSLVLAKSYINRGLRLAHHIKKTALLYHATWPLNSQPKDLPSLTPSPSQKFYQFPQCNKAIGFYPIVDRADQLKKLFEWGVRVAQLRIKDLRGSDLETEIKEGILLSKKYTAQLFINDYWDLAIQWGAYGIHLGQEDLKEANLDAISKSGLRLGLSTHSYQEVAAAKSIGASYLAVGPIFKTKIKEMLTPPQGIEGLKLWKHFVDIPLVAIGGISLEKASTIIDAGADGIAVISDIRIDGQKGVLEERVYSWLSQFSLRHPSNI